MSDADDDDFEILLPEEQEFHESARIGNATSVKTFIRSKINVNCMDEKDRTALHLAAGQGHVDVLEMLIDADAKIEFADKYGMNALLWAAWFGQKDAMQVLIKSYANVKAENKMQQNIVHCAAARGHLDVLKYIVTEVLETIDSDEDDEVAEEPDEELPTKEDQTKSSGLGGMFGGLMKLVADKITTDDVITTTRGPNDFMEWRYVFKEDSKTPLLMTCQGGHLPALEYLIESRCNKHARTENASTGLHLAAAGGHADVVSKLLECELEIDVRNEEGKTPLHMAAENGHSNVVALLLQRKANGNVKSSEKVRLFGAIHFAAKNNHTHVIKTLAKYRCDMNLRAENQNSALHIASVIGRCEAIDAILDGGGNVNAMNEKKRTSLHEAVENGFIDAVEKLLVGGIYVPQTDKFGKTALMMAARAENITCVDMIIKAERFITKRKQKGKPYVRGSEEVQFRKERNASQQQMRPVCWDLATKHLTQDDMGKLIFFWSFTNPQIDAIQSQFTGKKTWKEHLYRIMLIWLHGTDDNPLKEMYESLVAIGRKKLGERVRRTMIQQGNGKGCLIS